MTLILRTFVIPFRHFVSEAKLARLINEVFLTIRRKTMLGLRHPKSKMTKKVLKTFDEVDFD